jgi:metal-sulfur cluster biosynthetic enzyme
MVKEEDVIAALREVHDPEISINVYDLGLIYHLDVAEESVIVKHTLTSVMCPFADQICQDITDAIKGVEGVATVERELVWDPPFSMDMVPEETKFALGWDIY